MVNDLSLPATLGAFLRRGRITLSLTSPGAGALALAWALAPVGVKTKHPVLIAVAVKAKRAGTGRVTLRLTAAAQRVLRQARHGVSVAGVAEFKPSDGRAARVKRTFQIKP